MGIGAIEVNVVCSTTEVSEAELLSTLTVLCTVVWLVRVCVDAENEVDVIVVKVVSSLVVGGKGVSVTFVGTVNVTDVEAMETTATFMAAQSVN